MSVCNECNACNLIEYNDVVMSKQLRDPAGRTADAPSDPSRPTGPTAWNICQQTKQHAQAELTTTKQWSRASLLEVQTFHWLRCRRELHSRTHSLHSQADFSFSFSFFLFLFPFFSFLCCVSSADAVFFLFDVAAHRQDQCGICWKRGCLPAEEYAEATYMWSSTVNVSSQYGRTHRPPLSTEVLRFSPPPISTFCFFQKLHHTAFGCATPIKAHCCFLHTQAPSVSPPTLTTPMHPIITHRNAY